MKYLIASDIHGSAYYCDLLAGFYRRCGADRLVLLGDLLYHGARNALPRDYDTVSCTKILNGLKREIIAVRGNCDSEVDQMVLEFPMMADYAVLQLGGKTAFLAHGHKTPACLQEGTFCSTDISTCPPLSFVRPSATSTAGPSPSPKRARRTPASSLRRMRSPGTTSRRVFPSAARNRYNFSCRP